MGPKDPCAAHIVAGLSDQIVGPAGRGAFILVTVATRTTLGTKIIGPGIPAITTLGTRVAGVDPPETKTTGIRVAGIITSVTRTLGIRAVDNLFV